LLLKNFIGSGSLFFGTGLRPEGGWHAHAHTRTHAHTHMTIEQRLLHHEPITARSPATPLHQGPTAELPEPVHLAGAGLEPLALFALDGLGHVLGAVALGLELVAHLRGADGARRV
jgi:hypothetical protein